MLRWVATSKLPDRFDFVSKQLNADRLVPVGGEEIDDPAAC